MGTVYYTDEALLLSGDLEDFGRFYDRYVKALLAFFQRRTSNPEVSADLTAETFAAAMVARGRYEARTATAAAWLFAIAHHKLTDYQRRGVTEDRMRSRLGMEWVAVSAEDAEMIRWLGEEVASQMVEDLPPDQRDAIRAHVLEDRDYADIARSELLRAGATKPSRSAHAARALRPLAAAAAVALVVLAVVLVFPRGDEPPSRPSEPAAGTLQLSYRGEPSSAEASARVMTERLTAAGVRDAGVSVAAGGTLAITVPSSARADVAALADRGRLAVYDWERSVLGPRSTPAPRDERVTGGPDAGRDAATTKSVAEARAADAPGGRAVRALSVAPDGWFALGGPPALTNADIQGARPDVDPATQEPIVALHLTADGRKAFSALTRDLARRGSTNADAGSGNERPSTSPSWSTTGSCPFRTSTSGRRPTASTGPPACRSRAA